MLSGAGLGLAGAVDESCECLCGTSIYIQSLAHHLLNDHIGAKSWACGHCDFQSPDLNVLLLHAFRQRHDPRSIISPSLDRLLESVSEVWLKAGGGRMKAAEEAVGVKEDETGGKEGSSSPVHVTNSPSTSSGNEEPPESAESSERAVDVTAEESDHSHADSRDSPFPYTGANSPAKRLRLMPQSLSHGSSHGASPARTSSSSALDQLGLELRRKLAANLAASEAANRASPSALTRLWVMKGLESAALGLPLRGTPSPSLPLPTLNAHSLHPNPTIPTTGPTIPAILKEATVTETPPPLKSSAFGEVKATQPGPTNGASPHLPPWNRICALCGLSVRVYNNRNQIHRGYIQTHVHRRHLDVYGWACSECGKHFKSKDTARAHVRGSHPDVPNAKASLTCPADLYARQTKEAMVQCFPDIDMSFYKVITE